MQTLAHAKHQICIAGVCADTLPNPALVSCPTILLVQQQRMHSVSDGPAVAVYEALDQIPMASQ